MKLKNFKKLDKKKQTIIIMGISILLLITALLIYKSYAIYTEKENLNMMKGLVPDQDYDTMVTFIKVDENGNKETLENMPEGKNWTIEVSCNNNATAKWNYESWKLEMVFSKTRTKCKLSFYPYRSPLADYGIEERVVESGNGLYRVTHENANILANLNAEQKTNLQKTEYRYAGVDPNNYVTFNDEVAGWRIIGLVNTPEGQRLKLIRKENIGAYSWDSSTTDVNGGRGINEWSQSDLMTLLNSGLYYNRGNGTCYNDSNNAPKACDFRTIGLTNEAKEMIDKVTWNTGAVNHSTTSNELESNANKFYELERNNKNGKSCTSGAFCTDTVTRTTLWAGQVGLIYPSDHSYATSGGPITSRSQCLEVSQQRWIKDDVLTDCANNDWITTHWTMTPAIYSTDNSFAIYLSNGENQPILTNVKFGLFVNPVINLKTNIKVISGDGTEENPYTLSKS